jgi:hypothetical protein
MKVLHEKVLSVRGGWVVKGRVILYHGDRVRREEIYLERDQRVNGFQEVGFSLEDLQTMQQLLVNWVRTLQ